MKNTNKKNISDESLYEIIGNRINKRRVALHIDFGDFAKQLNISASALENIEKGKQKISIDLLSEIADLLKLNKMYLLTGIENKNIVESLKVLNNYIDFFKMVQSMSEKNRERLFNIIKNQKFSKNSRKNSK